MRHYCSLVSPWLFSVSKLQIILQDHTDLCTILKSSCLPSKDTVRFTVQQCCVQFAKQLAKVLSAGLLVAVLHTLEQLPILLQACRNGIAVPQLKKRSNENKTGLGVQKCESWHPTRKCILRTDEL